MATSLHRLLRKRARIRWNWVAPLAALLIVVELFNNWWNWRSFSGSTFADVAPYFVALILLFLAASATLPDEVPDTGLDLGHYFDETRAYFWTVYGCYLIVWIGIGTSRDVEQGASFAQLLRNWYFDYGSILACFVMVFVRPRWISGAAILITLIWLLYGFGWWTRPLSAS